MTSARRDAPVRTGHVARHYISRLTPVSERAQRLERCITFNIDWTFDEARLTPSDVHHRRTARHLRTQYAAHRDAETSRD